jgi:hypothetical protein
MKTVIVAVLAFTLLIPITGCQEAQRQDQLLVHVFRDPDGPLEPWLSKALAEFQASDNAVFENKRIVIGTLETKNYFKSIPDLGKGLRPHLVILNPPQDGKSNPALSNQIASAVSLCKSGGTCPAFVTSWSSGEGREAALRVLEFLATKRQ